MPTILHFGTGISQTSSCGQNFHNTQTHQLAKKLEHKPSLGSTSFDWNLTTATKSWILLGTIFKELAIENDLGLTIGKRSKRYSKGIFGVVWMEKS